MNFVNLLLLISASQGFIFGIVILFSPFFKSKANNYLGYSILILSLLMLNMFMDSIGFFDRYSKLRIIDDIEWIFLFPVMFFFYITTLIDYDLQRQKRLRWLYVPILLSIILNVVFVLEVDYKIITFENTEGFYSMAFEIEELGYYLYNLILIIWSYRLIRTSFSKYNELRLKWINSLWLLMFVITVSWIILNIIEFFGEEWNSQILIGILAVGLSFLIYWSFYNGIYKLKLATDQKEILEILNKKKFSLREYKIEPPIEKKKPSDNFDKDTGVFSKDNIYFKELESLLYDQYIYRNPNLNRDSVAERLGISSGYLSQIINSVTGNNFAGYINSFRVEEAKRMILDFEFEKYSLLAIGLEAGFKSKTTFYKVFKKETGVTPSEFKKSSQ